MGKKFNRNKVFKKNVILGALYYITDMHAKAFWCFYITQGTS